MKSANVNMNELASDIESAAQLLKCKHPQISLIIFEIERLEQIAADVTNTHEREWAERKLREFNATLEKLEASKH